MTTVLDATIIRPALSQVEQTSHLGYGFVRLKVSNKGLTSLDRDALVPFATSLRFVDLSSNQLSSLTECAVLDALVSLDASNNALTSGNCILHSVEAFLLLLVVCFGRRVLSCDKFNSF